MSGTEDMSSAWAERTLAVLLLPFAFIVMLGGGAGLIWLWQDYRAQFWIGACVVGVVAVAFSAALSAVQRQQRRTRWLAGRAGAADGYSPADDFAEPSSDRDLLLDVLARVETMQQNVNLMMGEFTQEQQRGGSGRHAGPVLVDIRDDVNDFDDDFDDGFDGDDLDDDEQGDEYDDYSDIDTRSEFDDNEPHLTSDDDGEDHGGDVLDDELDDGRPGSLNHAGADPAPPEPPAPRNGEPQPDRRMRRLVRGRGRQHVDGVPAQREPVQVIELPRDGDAGALADSDDDDEDYYGDDFNEDLYNETASAEGDLESDTDPAASGADQSHTDDDPREGGRRRRDAR